MAFWGRLSGTCWHSLRNRRYMEAEENVHLDEDAGQEEVSASAPEAAQLEEEPAAEAAAERADAEPQKSGYDESSHKTGLIIHTYSGFENKGAESLHNCGDAFGVPDK